MFNEILKKFDFFSSGPKFNIHNNKNLQTEIGGSFSFIILGLVIFFSWSFGNDLIYKNYPRILMNSIKVDFDKEIFLNNNNFFLGFILQDLSINMITDYDKIIRYRVVNYERKFNNVTNEWDEKEIQLNIIPCNEVVSNSSVLIQDAFNKSSFHDKKYDLLCIDNLNLNLTGTYDSFKINLIKLEVYKCINQSSYNNFDLSNSNYKRLYEYKDMLYPAIDENCLSNDEIYQRIDGSIFSIYSFDTIVDTKNYENPMKLIPYNNYQILDNTLTKDDEIFFGHLNITTDHGWIFEELKTLNTYKIDKVTTFYNTFSPENNYYYTCWIYVGKQHLNYERNYIKVQEIIASLGGIINLFWLFSLLIITPINNKMINFEIMNDIFDFKELSETRKSISMSNGSTNDDNNQNGNIKYDIEMPFKTNKNISLNFLIESLRKFYRKKRNYNRKKYNDKNKNYINIEHDVSLSNNCKIDKHSKSTIKEDVIINDNSFNISNYKEQITCDPEIKNRKEFKDDKKVNRLNKILEQKNNEFKLKCNLINDKKRTNLEKFDNTHHLKEFPTDENTFKIKPTKTIFNEYLKESDGKLQVYKDFHSKIKYSLCEIIISVFCCNKILSKGLKTKEIYYKKCLLHTDSILNINTLISKIKEIDILKFVVLNNHQNKCFEYIAKPTVTIDKLVSTRINEVYDELFNVKSEERIKKLVRYFSELEILNENSCDYKILEFMDPEVRDIIFHYINNYRFN